MAGVELDGGGRGGGRKPVSMELSMVPMIDLLLCCIMFLLVTAVWSQLASLNATQNADGGTLDDPTRVASIALVLSVRQSGYVLGDSAGARAEIPRRGGALDQAALGEALRARRVIEPNRRDLVVAPEDGVHYAEVMAAMDTSVGQGYSELSLSADGAR